MPGVLEAVAATPGVVLVTPPVSSPSGAIAVAQAFPADSPQSERTEELVRNLRDDVLPAAADGSGLVAHVGGQTASGIDFAQVLSARLPWFIGAVLLLSFMLLLVVFRSVLVPLKAVVMNLLSIAAAYGVMVAVFQWGWLGSAVRRRRRRAHRAVGADDALRHRVRPVDGLRGVPALVGQGGVRPHRRQQPRRGRGAGVDAHG